MLDNIRKDKTHIHQNLDLSIITVLPIDNTEVINFEKISAELKINGLEIIIFHHCSLSKWLIEKIEKYPFTNFVLISIENIYDIFFLSKKSLIISKKYVCLFNIFLAQFDVKIIESALYMIENHTKSFVRFKEFIIDSKKQYVEKVGECILLSKNDFYKLGSFTFPTPDSVEIMSRKLEFYGIKRVVLRSLPVLFSSLNSIKPTNNQRDVFYPKIEITNKKTLHKIEFHWNKKIRSQKLCLEYLKHLESYFFF